MFRRRSGFFGWPLEPLLIFTIPLSSRSGRALIGPRFKQEPDGKFVAEVEGGFAGSGLANRWGSVGVFGPLSVHPDFWGQRLGQRLMEPCMDTFVRWGCNHVLLFTFPHSAKHVVLYQKFGFWPRFLTFVMSRLVRAESTEPFAPTVFSKLSPTDQAACLNDCRQIAEQIHDGLDLTQEIVAVHKQKLGDTVLVYVNHRLKAFAVCQFGAGTEGGPTDCYVKFGAVYPGPAAQAHFDLLLEACDELALARGLKNVLAGVSTARHEAYRHMVAVGFRSFIQGLGMALD